jgi:hypothetical protein
MPAIPTLALIPPKPQILHKPERLNICKSCDHVIRDTDECGCSD